MSSRTDLPPMPDRHSGEPRPPRGPVHKPSNEKRQPWNARKVPQPPEGEGPPLEWDYGDRRAQIWTFVIAAAIVVVFHIIRDELDWLSDWEAWVSVIVIGLLMAAVTRGIRISAGADWLMKRKEFIKTYELTSIKFEKNFSEGGLDLDDNHGNSMHASLGWLRINESLWDLVYNGIRHSVANGATVNDMAVRQLRLHDVVAIRDQRAQDQTAGDDQP